MLHSCTQVFARQCYVGPFYLLLFYKFVFSIFFFTSAVRIYFPSFNLLGNKCVSVFLKKKSADTYRVLL